jgi:type IV pilus biogenesis protein PilP
MTSEPHIADPKAASKPRFALAMDMEGLALMERGAGGWVRRAEVSLNETDFTGRMGGLRDDALALGAGDGVELWLPAEQILTLRIAPDASGPGPFRRALAAATPHNLDELTWDWVAVEGGFTVVAAWTRTVREAREFASKWDLPVARVTTRAVDAEFPGGPSFALTPPPAPAAAPGRIRRAPLAALGAGAGAVGLGLWWWLSLPPDLPNPQAEYTPPAVVSAEAPEVAPGPTTGVAPVVVAPQPAKPAAKPPLLERPPVAAPPAEPPQTAGATPLNGGGGADQAPKPAARDAAPGHAEAPGNGVAPAPDQAARPVVEPAAPSVGEAPPTVARPGPLSAPAAPPPDAVAATAPPGPPRALTRVSVLAEEPKGLADTAPPPEVTGTEFDPLLPPPDAEEIADAEEEPDAAADVADDGAADGTDDATAEATGDAAGTPEVPAEFVAGPETPRPPAKPGEEAKTAAAPPPPPDRPEAEEATGKATEESASDEASTHALAAAPRPFPKPISAKDLAEAEDLAPTRLAALAAPPPVGKPAGLKRRAGALAVARAKARDEARQAKSSAGGAVDRRDRRQIPASASLARSATTRNAVELGETILVGVFGASSSRRAILRLPSGEIRRVKSGESVDGWKVASIGQSSIKLTKSGKSQTLNVRGE